MTSIEIKRSDITQLSSKRKYWKTYAVFGGLLGICAVLNIIASVESMYSSTNSQEFEFKKVQLTNQIQQLEKQKSELTNLHSIQAEALASGFVQVSQLHYVSTPMSQKVAER
ncbi:MAG: hypothetical protein ABI425_00635 [Patescibacteria group bacterium]